MLAGAPYTVLQDAVLTHPTDEFGARANTLRPVARISVSNRSIVSFGPKLHGRRSRCRFWSCIAMNNGQNALANPHAVSIRPYMGLTFFGPK